MIRIVKNMAPDDEQRPSLKAVRKFTCPSCITMDSRSPVDVRAHPPRDGDRGYLPGEFLHLDSVGGFDTSRSTDGATDAITVTDDASGVRLCLPVPSKATEHIAKILTNYQAQSQVPIKRILADDPILKDAVVHWCETQPFPVAYMASPPKSPQSNGRAESTVGYCKSKARTFRQASGASANLHSFALSWAAITSNFLPSSTDPLGSNRSPVQIFPDFPYRHRNLRHDLPFGCRAFVYEEPPTGQHNLARRARPTVFVGWSTTSPSYKLLDLDTMEVYDRAAGVRFNCTSFPMLEMKTAGEALPSDIALDLDGWRSAAFEKISDASDHAVAHWCAGKQLALRLPSTFYPQDSPFNWTVRCLRVAPQAANNAPVQVTSLFVEFSGPITKVTSPTDRQYHSKPILMTMPVSKVREAIKFTYPLAKTLSDLAVQSAARYGLAPHPAVAPPEKTPVPKSSHEQQHDLHAPTQEGTRTPTPRTIVVEHPAALRRSPRTLTGARRAGITRLTSPNLPARGTHFISAYKGAVGWTPSNLRQAKKHDSWNQWHQAIIQELDGLKQRDVYREVPRTAVPSDAQILSTMYTFADKPKAAKARLVILGHRQKIKPTAVEKFAATPGMTSFRVMCAVATQHDDEIDHMDISQAFTQADAFRDDVHIYVNPPEFSNTPPNMVWRLIRPLYGLAIAPAAWSATMQNFLLTDNWTQVTGEECMYTKPTQSGYRLLLTCYVDDILISYHRNDGAEAAAFKARLMTRFSARDEGPVTRYLGLDVTRDRIQRTLTLSQEQYTLDVLERHGMSPATVNACETPLSLSAHLTRADSPTTPDSALGTKYRDAVGCIQWLAGATRPDLAFAAQYLARFSSNPGAAHWREVKHCLRYLCGTADLSLQFSSSNPNHLLTDQLYGFCDSDWGSDTDTRRSVRAYVLFLNGSHSAGGPRCNPPSPCPQL